MKNKSYQKASQNLNNTLPDREFTMIKNPAKIENIRAKTHLNKLMYHLKNFKKLTSNSCLKVV